MGLKDWILVETCNYAVVNAALAERKRSPIEKLVAKKLPTDITRAQFDQNKQAKLTRTNLHLRYVVAWGKSRAGNRSTQ